MIQSVIPWYNCHLYDFTDVHPERDYPEIWRVSVPSPEDDLFSLPCEDSMKTKISSRLQRPGDKILYTYDFGDSWTHIIKLEEIKDLPETTLKCLAGKGACPPEDVGGFPGYEAMKEVFASDPQGDEAQSYREWLGFDENDDWVFDPHEFDTHSANEKLERRVTKRLSRKSADSSEDKLLS